MRVIWLNTSTREPRCCSRGSSLSNSVSLPLLSTRCSPAGGSGVGGVGGRHGREGDGLARGGRIGGGRAAGLGSCSPGGAQAPLHAPVR
jgi:hypothetical protein